MPLIDLSCHLGVTAATLACAPPDLDAARAYADQFGVETLCLTASEANTDLNGGNARLAEALSQDARFRGWLTLSVHQPELSLHLAAHYFRQSRWAGARFEQTHDADDIGEAGGHEIINGLRRYSLPVFLTVHSQSGLHAAVAAAREFHTLKFLLSPQSEELSSDILPAVRDVLNISIVPVAAYVERDVIAQAIHILGERGERRVFWGSEWGRFHPAAALGMMKDAAITVTQRERIMYRNARELLGA